MSTRPPKPTAPEQAEPRAAVPDPRVRWAVTGTNEHGTFTIGQVMLDAPKRPPVPRLPHRD